ncbi:hypothetical protein [Gordonia crocea]|uniref:DUF8017 domain-containing protein n=1 Tax=Gordonia crocea TaxID=589162 RepID=A0A7M3SU33_9ACTN|nr:hypothetical protein [Gordonia crocea]GED96157.1 hypothetical protein nbrc107697_01960 [Gordonia crocea]
MSASPGPSGPARDPYVDDQGDVWTPVPDSGVSGPAAASPPSARRFDPALVKLGVLVTVIAVVVGGLWVHSLGKPSSSRTDDVLAELSKAQRWTPPAPTRTAPRRGCTGLAATPTAQTPPGWKTVVGTWGLTYDVPAEWTVSGCNRVVGWEYPCDDGPFGFCVARALDSSAVQRSREARCLGTQTTIVGFGGAARLPDIRDALDVEKRAVKRIYTSSSGGPPPLVEMGSERSITVAGRPAVQQVASVSGISPKRCIGPRALHSMIATRVPAQRNTVIFVISIGQGYDGAPEPSVIDRIVATLRPSS